MTLEEFLDEWHRQANEYGASLTQDQRDIAEQAWLIATQQERDACRDIVEECIRTHAHLASNAWEALSEASARIYKRGES